MGFYDEKWEGVENKDNYDINKFEGEHKNGEPNGQGTVTYSNGNKYVGGWKDGKFNGQGHTLGLIGKSMLGNGRKGTIGTEILMTKTETS